MAPTAHIDSVMEEEGTERLTDTKRRWGERSAMSLNERVFVHQCFSVVILSSGIANDSDANGVYPITIGQYGISEALFRDHRVKSIHK